MNKFFKKILFSFAMSLMLLGSTFAMENQPIAREQVELVKQEQVELAKAILQVNDETNSTRNKKSLLKAILVLGIGGAVIIILCLAQRAKAISLCEEMCRREHHHGPDVKCFEIYNMGFGGFEIIDPDDND